MRRRASLCLLSGFLLLGAPSWGAENDAVDHGPTFFRDVLPILQENCQTCHRSSGENIGGMLAPMTLMTYDEVRPWARGIARSVKNRDMPPWFASEETSAPFKHQRRLSEEQIDTLVAWSSNGAPRGDAGDAPPPRVFAEEGSQGWTNGIPDLVVSLPEPYWVSDDVEDLNISFTHTLTEAQLTEDMWVQGVEFKVGGPHVHHMCASAVPPGETQQAGFTGTSLGCIALGAEPTLLPDGYAYFLPKGSTLRFSMHYHKEPGPGTGKWDQSQMGLVEAAAPVRHRVRYDAVGNTVFEVPSHARTWRVGAAKTYVEDTTLLALWPHAHLRAYEARYEAFYPDGTHEVLLDVPRYDQEWQTTYLYKEPKQIPAGTRIEATIWYDNTPERGAEKGFEAAESVRFGGPTTAEMMLGFLNYTHTEPIDFEAHPERIETAALPDPDALTDVGK